MKEEKKKGEREEQAHYLQNHTLQFIDYPCNGHMLQKEINPASHHLLQ